MPATVSDLDKHLGYWLRFVSNHVSGAFRHRLAGHDVTVAEWVALRSLYTDAPCSLGQLAAQVGVDAGATSRLVERLIQKKLATRKVLPKHRRAVALDLTPAGRGLVPKLAKEADENDETFFRVLSKADKEHLVRTMKRLVTAHGLTEKPTD